MNRKVPSERFWSKVQKGKLDECWLWIGAVTPGPRGLLGYGHFYLDGKHVKAHRVAYELEKGPIPEGKIILHSCDNTLCCNPVHLRIGTQTENMKDRTERGRQSAASGEAHGRAKLTEAQVKEIRQRAANGEKNNALAKEFGVSAVVLGFVVNRQTWRHVE